LTRAAPSSFTLKLVVYFLLLSLLPAAAAFWGFSSVARESEARRVDARLQAGLRAATFAYEERVRTAERAANALANDVSFQQALLKGDETVVRSALSESSDVRIESPRLSVGPKPTFAVERVYAVVDHEGAEIGLVVASVAFDQKLLTHLHRRSGLEARERVVVVEDGRIVVAPTWLRGPLEVEAGRTATISIANDRYRSLVGPSANGTSGPALAVLAPQSEIDAASTRLQRRLIFGLLAAVVLIALVAYFEGRTIVRAVSRIAIAANAISRGKLDERVPVRGRDELAKLGSAFNQMADQLQVRLEELESERGRLRDALSRFGDALAATHDVDQLLRSIVETAVEATDAHGGMLLGADGHVVEVGVAGAGSDQLEIPLHAGKVGFGTLFLFGRNFDDEARMTAISLVSQSVMALENARLHRIVERQALSDGLTGLANRRHAEESLATELSRADRFGGPLSVVVTDIDDFKTVNDEHGHPVGDTVLCEFARLLESSVRDVDVAGRWGGEEFLLILPGTDAEGAVRLAGRIRALLEDRTMVTPEGVPVRITSSFGVAAYEEGTSAEELVAAADAALYEAKRTGKNRVARAPGASAVRNLR
jgi:diguanylate cyclase (GGDEF)-like protein